MMDEESMQEARQDIKSMKESLTSIDKNLSLSIFKLNDLTERTIKLENKVSVMQDQLQFVNAVMKTISVAGGIALFFVEALPYINKLLH